MTAASFNNISNYIAAGKYLRPKDMVADLSVT